MSSHPPDRFLALTRFVPDRPDFVEMRSLLLEGTGELVEEAEGFAVTDAQRLIAAVWGRPSPPALAALAARLTGPEPAVLGTSGNRGYLAEALPGWRAEEAKLYVLPEGRRPTAEIPPGRLRALTARDPLSDLPAPLEREIGAARARGKEVLAWFEDDRPVAFGYTPWVTETWADISIDTIARYRRRGIAEAVVSALVATILGSGRRPVWGALESNLPSNALARKLGFELRHTLAVFQKR